jgi:hypothetical protein
VAIDLKGFRSGSLNEGVITVASKAAEPVRPPRIQV